MTEPKAKTPKEAAAKKHKFLCDTVGNGYNEKTEADFAQKAWGDMNIRRRFYDVKAPTGDRNNLRQFAKDKAIEIGTKIQDGDDGGFVYKGKSEAAQKAVDMLAKSGVEIVHIGHIVKLRKAVMHKHGGSLDGGVMTFGRAQKLLNMYLKYMWCAGRMPEPPHCPFDDNIIRASWNGNGDFLGGLKHLGLQPRHTYIRRWTKSDSVEDYLVWLAAAEHIRKFGYASVAEWELFEFERLMGRSGNRG